MGQRPTKKVPTKESYKKKLWSERPREGFGAEGLGDHLDVGAESADVGACWFGRFGETIAVEGACDLDIVFVFLFGESLDGIDEVILCLGDGVFVEDCGDTAFDGERGEAEGFDGAGLGFGADAEDGIDFDIVGLAEVVKGIVAGDHQAFFTGDLGEGGFCPRVDLA